MQTDYTRCPTKNLRNFGYKLAKWRLRHRVVHGWSNKIVWKSKKFDCSWSLHRKYWLLPWRVRFFLSCGNTVTSATHACEYNWTRYVELETLSLKYDTHDFITINVGKWLINIWHRALSSCTKWQHWSNFTVSGHTIIEVISSQTIFSTCKVKSVQVHSKRTRSNHPLKQFPVLQSSQCCHSSRKKYLQCLLDYP